MYDIWIPQHSMYLRTLRRMGAPRLEQVPLLLLLCLRLPPSSSTPPPPTPSRASMAILGGAHGCPLRPGKLAAAHLLLPSPTAFSPKRVGEKDIEERDV